MATSMSTLLLVLSLCVFATRTISEGCTETCHAEDGTVLTGKQKSCRDDHSYYVECVDGNATLHQCKDKESFYPSIHDCDTHCKKVFTFTSTSAVFYKSCEPIPYQEKPTHQFVAYPGDCKRYYWIFNKEVDLCYTAPGLSFDIESQNFIGDFDANCTCENPPVIATTVPATTSTTSTTTTTTTTTTTPVTKAAKVTSGSSNTGVIAGSLIAVLLIVIGGLGLAVFLRRRNKARAPPHVEEAKPGIYRISSIQSDTYDELKEVDPPYDNNVSVLVARSNVSTLNRGPLPDAPDGTYEYPAYKTGDVPEGVYQDPATTTDSTYLQPGQMTGDLSTADADEGEQNKMDVNENDTNSSVLPPPEEAPSTPANADVTDDASQDNENKGG